MQRCDRQKANAFSLNGFRLTSRQQSLDRMNLAKARKSASDRSAPGADGMVADMRYLYANAAAAKWKKAAEGKSLRNRRCLRLVSLVRFFARRKEMNEKISRPARVVRGRVSEKKSH